MNALGLSTRAADLGEVRMLENFENRRAGSLRAWPWLSRDQYCTPDQYLSSLQPHIHSMLTLTPRTTQNTSRCTTVICVSLWRDAGGFNDNLCQSHVQVCCLSCSGDRLPRSVLLIPATHFILTTLPTSRAQVQPRDMCISRLMPCDPVWATPCILGRNYKFPCASDLVHTILTISTDNITPHHGRLFVPLA
jgi:hypothetical protein